MKFLSITQRLSLIVGLLVLTITGIVTAESVSFRESMMQERREKIRDITDGAIAVMKYYDAEVTAGHLGMTEAQAIARLSIKAMRWGAGDYCAINRFDGVTLVHGNPKFENINRMDFVAADGGQSVYVGARNGDVFFG